MNIADSILSAVQSDEFFFFTPNSGGAERKRLRVLAQRFLECRIERQREFFARTIMQYVLRPHAKGAEAEAFGDVLNNTELFGVYDYNQNRKHLVHSVNTFLLGLLMYRRVHRLRQVIDRSMVNTTNRLSSGSAEGEFLFRWRLASLMHDIGNGIALFGDDTTKIGDYLFLFQVKINQFWDPSEQPSINLVLDLSRGKHSLEELDRCGNVCSLLEFFEELRANPYKGIHYDHGLMSALLMLRALDEVYAARGGVTCNVDGHSVSFDRESFDQSILRAAYAIAVHNLDFYPARYRRNWRTSKIFCLTKDPLVFLLKMADSLQEWNKARASKETDLVGADSVEIQYSTGGIKVLKLPNIDQARSKFDQFFDHDGLITLPPV